MGGYVKVFYIEGLHYFKSLTERQWGESDLTKNETDS